MKNKGSDIDVRTMNYPVIGEVWNIFQQTLMISAKKLADDIAKQQGADSKALWDTIKKKVNIGILDLDIPEGPTTCSYILDQPGIIRERCRSPCLLGYSACPDHIDLPEPVLPLTPVRRVIDFKGIHYFVDERGLALDSQGVPRGVVEDEVLYVFIH